jgi:hypothetical protein
MRFTIAAAAALVAGASASYNYTAPPVYSTTEIPCEGPTTITWSYGPTTTTVTVTEPTTVTLPCEVTPPAYSTPAYTPAPPAYTTPAYTPPAGTGYPVYPSANGTTYSAPPAGTGYPTASSPPPEFTGAASKAGVGLAAVFGLAAYIL